MSEDMLEVELGSLLGCDGSVAWDHDGSFGRVMVTEYGNSVEAVGFG